MNAPQPQHSWPQIAGDATADDAIPRPRALRPQGPAQGELVLWQGSPRSGSRRALELLAFGVLLGLMSWLAVLLIMPHFQGSRFAGNPDPSALPLILGMLVGMFLIIALPVWLRSSARGRARYMLTNRRALVWLGDRVIGEAILFGSELRRTGETLEFTGTLQWLDWRLKDEGMDRLRFENIADAADVAALAERHGARMLQA